MATDGAIKKPKAWEVLSQAGTKKEGIMLRALEPEEKELLQAIEKYKDLNTKLFLDWSEALEIFHSLGYRRQPELEESKGHSYRMDPKAWEARVKELSEAIEDHKQKEKKIFLSWCKVREIVLSLNYHQYEGQREGFPGTRPPLEKALKETRNTLEYYAELKG